MYIYNLTSIVCKLNILDGLVVRSPIYQFAPYFSKCWLVPKRESALCITINLYGIGSNLQTSKVQIAGYQMFTSAIRGLAMWLVKFSFVSCLASHLCWSLSPFSHRSISHKAQYGGAGQGARSGAFDTALGGYGYYGPNSRPNGPNGPNAGPNGPNGAYGVYGAYGPYGLFGPYGNPSNGLSGSEPLGPFGYLYASLGYGTSSTNSFWGHDLQLSCKDWKAESLSQFHKFLLHLL